MMGVKLFIVFFLLDIINLLFTRGCVGKTCKMGAGFEAVVAT